jgi:hypothetical protein
MERSVLNDPRKHVVERTCERLLVESEASWTDNQDLPLARLSE